MKHVPTRTCVCCKNEFPKSDLIRIVKNADGIFVDVSGKTDGRGAYFCGSEACKAKLIKTKCLDRAFRQKVSDDVYSALLKICVNKDDNVVF